MFRPIRPISLSKLRKLEHQGLVEGVISILKDKDLEALRLQNVMEMLLQLHKKLDKLEDKFGPHPLTKVIMLSQNRRLKLAGLISSHVQLLERANNEHQREAVDIVAPIVRQCLLKIRKDDKSVINGRLTQFFRELDKNPKLLEATTELGLKIYIDELRELNKNHLHLVMKRGRSIASRHTRQSKAIQKDCQAMLRSVFAQIELAQKVYPDQDYAGLIDSLNVQLAKFTRLIKSRATYNKKRALAKAKLAAETETTSHILTVDGKETGSVIIGGKQEVKKKCAKSKKNRQKKARAATPKAETIKPQEKENRNMDILNLPPGKDG